MARQIREDEADRRQIRKTLGTRCSENESDNQDKSIVPETTFRKSTISSPTWCPDSNGKYTCHDKLAKIGSTTAYKHGRRLSTIGYWKNQYRQKSCLEEDEVFEKTIFTEDIEIISGPKNDIAYRNPNGDIFLRGTQYFLTGSEQLIQMDEN